MKLFIIISILIILLCIIRKEHFNTDYSIDNIFSDIASKGDQGPIGLDFSTPLPTHLNTSAYFDALGDDYPDQSLRHQVRHGWFSDGSAFSIKQSSNAEIKKNSKTK